MTLGLAAGVLLLSGCSDSGDRESQVEPTPTLTVPPSLAMPASGAVRDPRRLLALVPADAEAVTITNWDAIRAQLGVNDLTSDSLAVDRFAFRERLDEAVHLTDGALAGQDSRLLLDFGFTQDDVDFELHWTGPSGAGYLLAFRPDQEMAEVAAAVDAHVHPLDGAQVLADEHVVGEGLAGPDEQVWASRPGLVDLVDGGEASTYLSSACIPVRQALGPDATYLDQDRLVDQADPSYLRPLESWSLGFTGGLATARIGVHRIDLHARADLMEQWPTADETGLDDAFTGSAAGDPATGRIGLQVADPSAAATVTLTGTLPFAVCNQVLPFEEPTGL